MAQVVGSGTAATSVSVKVPTPNPPGPNSSMSLPETVPTENGDPPPKISKSPAAVASSMPFVSRATTLVPPENWVPTGNNRLSDVPKVPAVPAGRRVIASPPRSPVIAVIRSPLLPVVTVTVPLPSAAKPPRLAAGPLSVQSNVSVSACAAAVANEAKQIVVMAHALRYP